jgi:hypothetical protein
MSDLRTSVIVDLAGNLVRKSRQYTRAMADFSRNSRGQLNGLNRGARRFGRTLGRLYNRYTALIGLGSAAAAVGNVINRDARLTQLQTDGRATEEQIQRLKKAMFELASDRNIRLDPDLLIGGVEEIITRTGDFEFAMEQLRNLALTIRATGSQGGDVGAVFSNFYKAGIRDAETLLKLTDALVLQTFQGSVAFRDVAKVGNKLFAPAVASGGIGEGTLLDAGAVAQIVIDAVGSPDEATESIKALYSFLEKKDVQKALTGAGIAVKGSGGKIRPLAELLPEIFTAAKGDFGVLGKLFGESGVKVFQGLSLPGNIEKLQQLSQLRTDGSLLLQNAALNAGTSKAAVQLISNKTQSVADEIISDQAKTWADAINAFETNTPGTNRLAVKAGITDVLPRMVGDSSAWWKNLVFGSESQTPGGQNFQGEVKIVIDQNNRAKVASVKSSNSNVAIEADTGVQMVNP